MILIRPLIRANAARLHNVHVVVFFIFLVGNIGGALSPLGDPPLFIGFLNGVDFFWPAKNLWQPTAFVAGCVLAIFIVIDLWFFRQDRRVAPVGEASAPIRVHGIVNLALLAVVIGAVIVSALWKPGVAFTVYGTALPLQNLLRDAVLFLTALASLWLTPDEHAKPTAFPGSRSSKWRSCSPAIFVCACRSWRCSTPATPARSPGSLPR